MTQSPLVLSAADRGQIEEVDLRAERGDVPALVDLLTARSWAVRRAVIAALARLGDEAIAPLVEVLRTQRDDEARLAAAVDALSASRGDADRAMLLLAETESAAPVICDAAQVLGRRRFQRAAPALARLTAHPDDNVSVAAIEALGRIGGGAGLDALIAVLQGKNFFRIFPSIDVLGRSGSPSVLGPLVALLDNPRYALEAARALGRTGEAAAAAPLAALLRRANDALTRVIAVSLSAIQVTALERFGTAAPVEAALHAGDPLPFVQRLAQSVLGAAPEEQAALCTVLAWVPDDTAAAALIGLLASTPAASAALGTLGRGSDAQLLAALREADGARRSMLLPLVGGRTRSAADVLACLDDPDPAVRVLACNALARIGDASAVPRLFELLRESDPMISQAAVAAIQSLGSPATEALALQGARAQEPQVRRAALRIVAYFGYPAGLDVLVAAVRGSDDRLRDAAIHGLALMEDPRALEQILETAGQANPRARAAAMRALGQSEPLPRATAALRSGLADADAWVRYYACQSLGRLREAAALPDLLRLVRDPAGQVRVAAVEALAHLDARAALESLQAATRSEDPDVQRAALLGLGAHRTPEALPTLLAAARGPEAATRLIALSAIASYSGAEPVAALAAAASDPEASVRDAALGFLAGRSEEDATAALITLLGHPRARERALDALATPVSGRIAAIGAALGSASAERSTQLVAALARMKRADAVAAIADALALGNVFARRAAAHALAALRSPSARSLLQAAVDSDADPEVRRAGLVGLGP